MVYPTNIEVKIGFDEIRQMLKAGCLSPLGQELAGGLAFSTQADEVNERLSRTREFRRLLEEQEDFPLTYFFDVRMAVARLRLENTHIEVDELFDMRRSLGTIGEMVKRLAPTNFVDKDELADDENEAKVPYPALYRLADGVATFPTLLQRIDQILDKYGHIRDNASPKLAEVRRELSRTEGNISRILYNILKVAQSEGVVEKDVTPTLRDGRLVIPVAPGLKRKIKGIVHDESATGKTVFIEPTEVVEANNRIRELESEERQEIVRILTVLASHIRPHVKEILDSYHFMARIDFIQACVKLADRLEAIEPEVKAEPHIDWIRAVHPLLKIKNTRQTEPKDVVPLDIMLTSEKRILVISGPNAGGKSVCLKTVGLLQYMLQCGLSIPVSERSVTGIFNDIMIDIGDEQSLENDLSTYSSHLLNMKNMIRQAGNGTLILIDEFGTGTEPQIGGAIAEAVLEQFCRREAYGVITTHYQNLKHFADSHEGVVNGAMLYDRHEMHPLFQLAIGRPGSSFAIEIARKIGLPETVIDRASAIVGTDYIQSDKYLQDIVRDKRYWENKRQNIHQREKDMEKTISRYEADLHEVEQQRRNILKKAREEAEELLRESNRRIENAIREIREKQAEKEETRRIRQELKAFEATVSEADKQENDDKIARKIAQIQQRKERHAKRKAEKAKNQEKAVEALRNATATPASDRCPEVGDMVRIKGLTSVGRLEQHDGKMATVIFGDMRTKMRLNRLEPATAASDTNGSSTATATTRNEELAERLTSHSISHETRKTIDDHKKNFRQDLDVRGMRGDEALSAVQYFIDDAILVGVARVRILHGKGNGILRQLIRDYLATVPNVTHYADEHVQFGGAGITVVDF